MASTEVDMVVRAVIDHLGLDIYQIQAMRHGRISTDKAAQQTWHKIHGFVSQFSSSMLGQMMAAIPGEEHRYGGLTFADIHAESCPEYETGRDELCNWAATAVVSRAYAILQGNVGTNIGGRHPKPVWRPAKPTKTSQPVPSTSSHQPRRRR